MIFTVLALTAPSRSDGAQAPQTPPDGNRRLEIRGTVVDDETGKPVPSFVVQYGRPDPKDPSRILWGWSETRFESANPEGLLSETLSDKGGWTRVLAAGYLPQPITAKPYDGENGKTEVTIRLRRGRQVAGRVLDQTNKPVAQASVFLVGGRGAHPTSPGAGPCNPSSGARIGPSRRR